MKLPQYIFEAHQNDHQKANDIVQTAGLRPASGIHVADRGAERILRLPQVKEAVGLGTTAIYEKMKHEDFPKPIKLGRLSGWLESEVQAWINRRILASRNEVACEGMHSTARS